MLVLWCGLLSTPVGFVAGYNATTAAAATTSTATSTTTGTTTTTTTPTTTTTTTTTTATTTTTTTKCLPLALINGNVAGTGCSGMLFGAPCTYTSCQAGWALVAQSNTRTCTPTGWTGEPAHCFPSGSSNVFTASLLRTSSAATVGAGLAFGETATLVASLHLPEGTFYNLSLMVELPTNDEGTTALFAVLNPLIASRGGNVATHSCGGALPCSVTRTTHGLVGSGPGTRTAVAVALGLLSNTEDNTVDASDELVVHLPLKFTSNIQDLQLTSFPVSINAVAWSPNSGTAISIAASAVQLHLSNQQISTDVVATSVNTTTHANLTNGEEIKYHASVTLPAGAEGNLKLIMHFDSGKNDADYAHLINAENFMDVDADLDCCAYTPWSTKRCKVRPCPRSLTLNQ